jgi:receptor protein-tyrosine kinase
MERAAGPVLPAETLRDTSIGSILVRSGRLTADDLTRIMGLQQKETLLFGEAAIKLGILTDEDVQWALATQYSYPYVNGDQSAIAKEVLAVREPFAPQVEAFRSIRSGLMLSGAGRALKVLAVVSPRQGDGRTFTAQLGSSTLLIDLNFRAPLLHELFKLKNNIGISSLIIRRATLDQAMHQTPLSALRIIPAGPKPPNPQELLGWPETEAIMAAAREKHDVVIIDTPPFLDNADALLISRLADAVIVVARTGVTDRDSLGLMKKQLDGAGVRIIGSVLNEIVGNGKPSKRRLSLARRKS